MELSTLAAASIASFFAFLSLSPIFFYYFRTKIQPEALSIQPKPIVESEKHGIDFVRKLTTEEIQILTKSLENVNQYFPQNKTEITWLNLFFNQRFTVNHPEQQKLDQFVNQLIKDNSPYQTNYTISYGFLINPAGSTKYQQFHFDYTTTSTNIFIPMTKVTFKNATQFLRKKMKSKMDYWNNFGEIEDIMEKEDIDFLEISQIACKPFLVTKMHPR